VNASSTTIRWAIDSYSGFQYKAISCLLKRYNPKPEEIDRIRSNMTKKQYINSASDIIKSPIATREQITKAI
jgi:hypothetical protein